MPRFEVARFRDQGVDLIVIPVANSFGHRPRSEQEDVIDDLQRRSRQAGLAGTVIVVWDGGCGHMKSIGPESCLPFLDRIGLPDVAAKIEADLSW